MSVWISHLIEALKNVLVMFFGNANPKILYAHLWVFARLYLEGKKEHVSLIYHIDFKDEDEEDSPMEDVPFSIQDRVPNV